MRTVWTILLAASLVVAAWAAGASARAQTSASFDLTWNVMANGGGESASAGYAVHGTTGQGLASPPDSTSAGYRVQSGFWPGGLGPDEGTTYLPSLSR